MLLYFANSHWYFWILTSHPFPIWLPQRSFASFFRLPFGRHPRPSGERWKRLPLSPEKKRTILYQWILTGLYRWHPAVWCLGPWRIMAFPTVWTRFRWTTWCNSITAMAAMGTTYRSIFRCPFNKEISARFCSTIIHETNSRRNEMQLESHSFILLVDGVPSLSFDRCFLISNARHLFSTNTADPLCTAFVCRWRAAAQPRTPEMAFAGTTWNRCDCCFRRIPRWFCSRTRTEKSHSSISNRHHFQTTMPFSGQPSTNFFFRNRSSSDWYETWCKRSKNPEPVNTWPCGKRSTAWLIFLAWMPQSWKPVSVCNSNRVSGWASFHATTTINEIGQTVWPDKLKRYFFFSYMHAQCKVGV